LVAALLGRLYGADEEVSADAVGDEGLGAVDDVAAVDLSGGRSKRRDVGPGAGLGNAQGSDQIPPYRWNQPALLLLLCAESPDRRRRDLRVSPDPGGDAAAAAGAGELLDPDGVVDVVAALPAVLGLVLEAEEAQLAAAVVQLARELPGLVPLLDVGGDLLRDEAANRLPQLLVLLREGRKQCALAAVLYDRDGGFQSSSIVWPRPL
jgi:hypothetical protein